MKLTHIAVLSLLIWGLLKLLPQPKSIGEINSSPSIPSGTATVDPFIKPTNKTIEHPSTKVSELYPEYSHIDNTSSVEDIDNSVYLEMLDWGNDEYWEIQELNGKYYRVLQDGAFEELDVYEEYEYEEEVGDIEDLYRYANDNKSRIIKAINKGY